MIREAAEIEEETKGEESFNRKIADMHKMFP